MVLEDFNKNLSKNLIYFLSFVNCSKTLNDLGADYGPSYQTSSTGMNIEHRMQNPANNHSS